VRAKHAYIKWANREAPDRTLLDLGREILNIARETDVLQMPIYSAPPIQDLVDAAKNIEAAKTPLIPGEDKISYISPDESDVDFDLTMRWAPEELISLAIKETIKFENMPMTLVVEDQIIWDLQSGIFDTENDRFLRKLKTMSGSDHSNQEKSMYDQVMRSGALPRWSIVMASITNLFQKLFL
jgi:hypothetical protein